MMMIIPFGFQILKEENKTQRKGKNKGRHIRSTNIK